MLKNVREETNSCRKFLIILVRYFAIKKREHNAPLLKYGLHIITYFNRLQYGKGGKNLRRNLTITTLVRYQLSINSHKSPGLYVSLIWLWWKQCFISMTFLPPNHNTSLRKTSNNSNRMSFCLTLDQQALLKTNKIIKSKNVWKTVTAKRSLGGM